ncbi:Type I restriction-modification system restriction subunit R [Lactococcus lactis subsp. lactis]|nr:Type I restriction-modification system restriction subunit R [Lactococcus lactis subsp. lactis]
MEEQLLTDKEFKQVKVEFSRLTGTPFLASKWLRGENGVAQVLLEREDGKKVTLEAFRNKDISGRNSSYEVVHQVVPDSSRVDRGDVSLLINGLPIIRFEGFTDDWEQRKLGEISRMYQPLTITGNDLLPDGVPVFGANGFIGFFFRS